MKLSRLLRGGVRGAEHDHESSSRADTEHRMRYQPHIEAAIGDLSITEIDQKRHIVVADFNDGLLTFAHPKRSSAPVSQWTFAVPGVRC